MEYTREELLAEKARRMLLADKKRQDEQFPATSRAMEGSTLKQGIAGIIPGIASIGDIPAAIYNLATQSRGTNEKGIEDPFSDMPSIPQAPYVFHNTGEAVADSLFGKPKTEGERSARMVSEIASSFINPTNVIKKVLSKIPSPAALAAKATKFSVPKYEALDAAGMTKTLGSTSDSIPVIMAEEGLKYFPVSSGTIMKARKSNVDKLENLFLEEANIRPGKVDEVKSRANLVTEGYQAYNDNAKAVASKLYGQESRKIKPDSPVPMDTALATINKSLETFSPEAKAILEKSGAGSKLVELKQAIIKNGGTLPYQDVKQTFIPLMNDLIDSWGQIGTREQGLLKRNVDAFNKDVRNYVKTVDPKAAESLVKADKFWADFSKRERKITNKGSTQTDPLSQFNSVYTPLLKGDTEPYRIATQHLPAPKKKAFDIELNTELGLDKGSASFDPFVWAKNFNKLRKPAQDAALSSLPKSSADKLRGVAKSFANIQDAGQYGNHSRTTFYQTLTAYIGSFLVTPITSTATGIAAYPAGKLFTNQTVIDAMYAASKARTVKDLEKVAAKFEPQLNIASIAAQSKKGEESPEQTLETPSYTREELLAEKARREALKAEATPEPEAYKKGGQITGSHYNYMMDEVIDMANNPIKETHIGAIKTWLKKFGDMYELEKDKAFKQAYSYIDKVRNKSQIPIMLNYINQIPNVSKKKMLEIRKAFIKAKNTKN